MAISTQIRLKVVRLKIQGFSFRKIVRMIGREDVVSVSVAGVRKIWVNYQRTGSVQNVVRFNGHRSPVAKLGTQEHIDFVDQCMKDMPDLSAKQLGKKVMDRFGIEVSVSSIGKFRKYCGWTQGITRYCQLIKNVNKVKRKDWCEEQVRNDEQFADVVFTDESRVELSRTSNKCFRKKGHFIPYIPKPKHPLSVLVWAGISVRGATELLVFEGIMDGEFYREEIVKKCLKPFVEKVYPDHHRLMQDNDPKHTAKATAKCFEDNNILWWKTPPESPDLNPIENLWHEMKKYIRSEVKPFTKQELVDGLHEFWRTRVTPEKCENYIDHLQETIPKVIEADGGHAGE